MNIAAIVPCYRVKAKIKAVLESIDPSIEIICVDDACPENSGKYVESLGLRNVRVIFNPVNLGVGGAVKAGYAYALQHTDADIMVKIDGDGQMPGEKIADLVAPILQGRADYVKGNRFYYIRNLKGMPFGRLIGNIGLSFLTKLSSGYWDLMDPTNGFTAISRTKLQDLDSDKIDNRYFFESSMLCELYLLNTVIKDFAMPAKYEDEHSNLRPMKSLFPFLVKNLRNLARRILYTYFVRDFNAGSLALVLHITLGIAGGLYGLINLLDTLETGQARASGVVMLTALSLIFSIQFLIFFLTVDIQNSPNIKPR
jgi:dolichol-phosphate mannosyltransferase